jgi:hypothetical protein
MGETKIRSSSTLPRPNVEHVMVAFDALRISPVPVHDLIGELERRGFDLSASIRAFDQAVMSNWLVWTEGVKLIKPGK